MSPLRILSPAGVEHFRSIVRQAPLILVLLILQSCKKDQPAPDRPLRDISYGFETPLEDWKDQGGDGERYEEDDILRVDSLAVEGSYAGRFEVEYGHVTAGGTRAEMSFDDYALEGDEGWYEWSIFFPTDYPDVQLEAADGAPNWQVVGQWHQQPVTWNGEDWNNYTGEGASPPVALYYNYLSRNDPAYLEALQDAANISVYGFDSTWDEVSTLSLSYLSDGLASVAIAEIPKGQWLRIKVHIRWSQEADGYVEAWIDGQPFTNGKVYGANMWNEASHYFKFGLYRNPDIQAVQRVWYDDIRIWH